MYKDQNREIIAEINQLESLKNGEIIARNSLQTTRVRTLGNFYSKVLDRDVYLALKEYNSFKDLDDLQFKVSEELGFIDLVENNLPQLLNEFPLPHGVLINQKNPNQIGVLTEDFSQNGKYPVYQISEWNKKILPYELQKLMGSPERLDDLATTCFLVNGKRRIGDFGEFFMAQIASKKLYLAKSYLRKISNYTLRLPLTD